MQWINVAYAARITDSDWARVQRPFDRLSAAVHAVGVRLF